MVLPASYRQRYLKSLSPAAFCPCKYQIPRVAQLRKLAGPASCLSSCCSELLVLSSPPGPVEDFPELEHPLASRAPELATKTWAVAHHRQKRAVCIWNQQSRGGVVGVWASQRVLAEGMENVQSLHPPGQKCTAAVIYGKKEIKSEHLSSRSCSSVGLVQVAVVRWASVSSSWRQEGGTRGRKE